MENNVDFDALNRKTKESGGARADLDNLFGATFALEKWLFIARGEQPNVTPYVAANAGYAGGQQMIRAFTDSERLARFAKENNLTSANGSAQMLGIPTGDAVEYLEQFIQYGAHGVWFNSDTESDGYFIPLAQLRPIKEHLAQIGWKSIEEPPTSNLENFGISQTSDDEPDLRIKVFKQGNVKIATSLVPFYAAIILRLKDYQSSGDFKSIFTFIPEAMKNLTENFPGNDHGKYFRVRKFRYFPPDGKAISDIQTIDSNELRHIQTGATLSMSIALVQLLDDTAASLYFGFEGGNIEIQKLLKAIAPALEAAGFVDDQAKNNSPAQTDAVDNNVAVDKNAGDYINWFRRGTIKPDTSFKPFFQAIAPLLVDYAGADAFEFSFATGSDEPGMRDLFEDVSSNSHGAYLKYRSYIFEPYEMQMIGSNHLTNVRTGEKLRIQLTMHKKLAEGTATFIVVFVGRTVTVETLENAVKSALDAAEYKVQLQTKKAADTETRQSIGVKG